MTFKQFNKSSIEPTLRNESNESKASDIMSKVDLSKCVTHIIKAVADVIDEESHGNNDYADVMDLIYAAIEKVDKNIDNHDIYAIAEKIYHKMTNNMIKHCKQFKMD